MLLYDKAGKEYNVPFSVDAKEWIASGNFFKEKPEAKKTIAKKTAPKAEK